MIRNQAPSILIAALALSFSACAGRTAAWQEKDGGGSTTGDAAAATTDAEAAKAAWAGRSEPAKVVEAIGHWEKVVAADPKNVEALVMLTRAHYYWADSFLRNDEAKYLATMDKAVKWGEKALVAASPEFDAKMRNKGKFEDAIKVIGPEGVPAAYWYATSLGKWAKRKSFAVLLGQKDNIRATMTRVLELDPNFYHGGPHRYFGAFYSVAPPFAGGDLDKSKVHYDESLKIAPYFPGTKVLMAENYSIKKDDEDLFVKLLEEVKAQPIEECPEEVRPECMVEKQKAEEMLAAKDEYF
jgi:hypothetical protein